MARHASIGVHDDLASSKSRVSDWTAERKATARIDEVFGRHVQELFRHGFADHCIEHAFLDLFVMNMGLMLCRHDDRVDTDWLPTFIFDGDLAFTVWQ